MTSICVPDGVGRAEAGSEALGMTAVGLAAGTVEVQADMSNRTAINAAKREVTQSREVRVAHPWDVRRRTGVSARTALSHTTFDAPRRRGYAGRPVGCSLPIAVTAGRSVDSGSPLIALSVTRLIAADALDAELAALLWLLVEGGIPLLVCGGAAEPELSATLDALLDLRPPADRDTTAHSPSPESRRPGTTLRAESLSEAFAILTAEPFGLSDDQLRSLGVVIVMRDGRAAAVHYLRPVERDAHGHLQHRPPAVLATSDPDRSTFEHFAWGITPELAARVNVGQADFERAQAARARFLARLVDGGIFDPEAVRDALDGYRAHEPGASSQQSSLASAGSSGARPTSVH